MRAWKFEAWIALAALIASALTASAALYQSKVFSDQLQATVWPYLSFNSTSSSSNLDLTLENDGAGPAIITGAQLLLDGKPEPSLATVLNPLGRSWLHSSSLGSVGPGQVIRPGAVANVVKVSGRDVRAHILPVYNRLMLRVWYCSLLNKCWVVKLHSIARPQEVSGENYPHTVLEPQ